MPQRRTPNAIRVLRGAPERSTVTAVGLGAPQPPTWLEREARDEWCRVVRATASYPTWLTEVDRAALVGYCTAWSTFVAAAKDVATRGPLVPARSSADRAREESAMVKNPSVQIARDAAATMRAWCVQLGFTPDARGKIEQGEWDDSDPDGILD